MNPAPPLSVVMAVHNGSAHLSVALDSIAAQTWSDFEVVVVDDGSTDATAAILDDRAARDRRFTVIRHERRGLTASLNRSLEVAAAPLIARHDADDSSLPERFHRQLAYLRDHPKVAVVGTGSVVIDNEGSEVAELVSPHGVTEVKQALTRLRATPVHGSVMFRKALVCAVGGYRPAFVSSQDLDLWLRVSEVSAIDNLPDPLYRWRVHHAGVFATQRATQLMYAGVAMTFAFERGATGSDSYGLLEACRGDLGRFSREYRFRGRLEQWWGELLFRGLDDPHAAKPHLRAALAAGRLTPRTIGLYGWSLFGLHWPGGPTLQVPTARS